MGPLEKSQVAIETYITSVNQRGPADATKKRLVRVGSGENQHLECWDSNWKLPFKRFACLFTGGASLDFVKITDFYIKKGFQNKGFDKVIKEYYGSHKEKFTELKPDTAEKIQKVSTTQAAEGPKPHPQQAQKGQQVIVPSQGKTAQIETTQPTMAEGIAKAEAAKEPSLGPISWKNLPEYMHMVETDYYAKPYPHKKDIVITYKGELRNWVDLNAQEKYEALRAHCLPHAKDELRPRGAMSEADWVKHIEERLLQRDGHNPDGSPKKLHEHDPRYDHGRDHAMGVAIFTLIFAHLYEKYLQAKPTPPDLFMMLLAGAFHDSGRQTEGVDIDEEESATNIHKKLTEWGVSEPEVATCYNAVKNKDKDWEGKDKSLVAKCLQCADSMAYVRTGNVWKPQYSDLFKETRALNPEALKAFDSELKALASEMSELTFYVGFDMRDGFAREDKNYFSEILKIINEKYPKMREILKAKQVLS